MLALVVDPRFVYFHDSVQHKFDPPALNQNHRNTLFYLTLHTYFILLHIPPIFLIIVANNYLSTVL